MLARLGTRHPLVIAAVIVTIAVTAATVAVTLAGFLADRWWVFDLLTSYRPQAALVLAAAVVALAVLRLWWLVPVAVIGLALNVTQVAPVYTGHQPAARADSPTLTVAHLNLQSNTADVPGMTQWLHGRPADIVVVLSTQPDLAIALHDGVDGYRMIFPVVTVVAAPPAGPRHNKGTTTSTTSTNSASSTTSTTSASSTATNLEFDPPSAEVVVFTDRPEVTASRPTTGGLPGSAVELRASIGAQPVTLLALHTQSPTTEVNHRRRDAQLDTVTTWLQQTPAPAVAFGDFNVTAYSPNLRRLIERSGARSSQAGFGVQATWPVQFRPAGIGIDQSIYTGGLTAVARSRGPSFGSEHRVLIVTYAIAAG